MCGLSGVMEWYEVSGGNVDEIDFVKDVKFELYECWMVGDGG